MVHKLIQRRVGDDHGYILVIMALAMVVLLGLTALVVDLGNGRQKRRQIQSTADAASLAGAQDFIGFPTAPTTANWNAVANTVRTYAQQNAGVPTASWSSCTDPGQGAYTVIPSTVDVGSCVSVDSVSTPMRLRVRVPTTSVQTSFARVLGIGSLSVSAGAIAEIGSFTAPAPLPCALCALGGTGVVIGLSGTPNVVVTSDSDAGVVANADTRIQGNASLEAPSIQVHGSAQTVGNGSYDPPPTTGVAQIPDPLAGFFTPPSYSMTPPPPDSADQGTIQPGTYRDLITGNHKTVTLAPGVYVITRRLAVGTQGTIQGTGVTLYFPPGASFAIGNQESINLSAPTTGPYTGLAMYFSPSNTSTIQFQAGASYVITGTIYGANASLDMQGGTDGSVLNSAVIVKQVSAGGNDTLTISYQSEQNPQPPKTTKTVPNLYR